MNLYLFIAAVLAFLMGIAHSIMGERYFLLHLFKRELPLNIGSELYINRTTRISWHLTTIAWWSAAAIMIVLSLRTLDQTAIIVVRIISNIFLLSGLLSLIGSRGRHLSWIVFFLIALISWLGSY